MSFVKSGAAGLVVAVVVALCVIIPLIIKDKIDSDAAAADATLSVRQWSTAASHRLAHLASLTDGMASLTESILRQENTRHSSGWKYPLLQSSLWGSFSQLLPPSTFVSIEPAFAPTGGFAKDGRSDAMIVSVARTIGRELESQGDGLHTNVSGAMRGTVFFRSTVNASDSNASLAGVARNGTVLGAVAVEDLIPAAFNAMPVASALSWELRISSPDVATPSVTFGNLTEGGVVHPISSTISVPCETCFGVNKTFSFTIMMTGGEPLMQTTAASVTFLIALLVGILVAGTVLIFFMLKRYPKPLDALDAPILAPMAILHLDLQRKSSLWLKYPAEMSEAMGMLIGIVTKVITKTHGSAVLVSRVGTRCTIVASSCVIALKLAEEIDHRVAMRYWPPELCRQNIGLPIRIGLHYSEEVSVLFDAQKQRYDYYGSGLSHLDAVFRSVSLGQEDRITLTKEFNAALPTKFTPELSLTHKTFERTTITLYNQVEVARPLTPAASIASTSASEFFSPTESQDAFRSTSGGSSLDLRRKSKGLKVGAQLSNDVATKVKAIVSIYESLRNADETVVHPEKLNSTVRQTHQTLTLLLAPLTPAERNRILTFFAGVFGITAKDTLHTLVAQIVLIGNQFVLGDENR